MHELEAIGALTWRDLKRFSRDRDQILGALARPLIWLLFIGKGLRTAVPAVGGMDYQHFIFPGAIAMTVLFSGMFQSISIIWDREFGFLKEVLVAPISRATIVIGKVLSGAVVTTLQGILAALCAPLVDIHLGAREGIALLGVIFLLSIAITALGVVVAIRMRTFEGFGVISNFVILPLYFLSGGIFPIENVPAWMSILIHINPVTYGVDLMRHAISQPSVFSLSLDMTVVGCFWAAMLGLALLLFRRG